MAPPKKKRKTKTSEEINMGHEHVDASEIPETEVEIPELASISEENTPEQLWLRFGNFVLRDGLNMTVRFGKRWLGYRGDVYLGTPDSDEVLAVAEIVDTLYVSKFEDLNEEMILQFEHDPDCRGFYSLVKVMQASYPGDHVTNIPAFKRDSGVTLVFFLPREISDGVEIYTPDPPVEAVAQVDPKSDPRGMPNGNIMTVRHLG